MALPTSGDISLLGAAGAGRSIRAEFAPSSGGYNLRAYLKNAGIVTSSDYAPNVPTSGNISMRNFVTNPATYKLTSTPPSYVGIGSYGSTPSIPSSLQTNDILILLSTYLSASPSGWTSKAVTNWPTPSYSYIYGGMSVHWRRHPGSTSSPSLGSGKLGYIIAFRGCVTSGDPFDVISSIASGVNFDFLGTTSVSAPSITTTVANTMVVGLHAGVEYCPSAENSFFNNGSISSGDCIPYDPGRQSGTNGGDSNWICHLRYGPKTTAGATGTITATGSADNGSYYANVMLAALKPA